MADRNRELVPDNWSLVTERALTKGLCSEGWYSDYSGVCRRAEMPGRSVHAHRHRQGEVIEKDRESGETEKEETD